MIGGSVHVDRQAASIIGRVESGECQRNHGTQFDRRNQAAGFRNIATAERMVRGDGGQSRTRAMSDLRRIRNFLTPMATLTRHADAASCPHILRVENRWRRADL
jgi:hypothetical protein